MSAAWGRVVRTHGLRTKLHSLSAPPIADKVDKALDRAQSQACPQLKVADNALLVLISPGVRSTPDKEGSGENYRPTTGCRLGGGR